MRAVTLARRGTPYLAIGRSLVVGEGSGPRVRVALYDLATGKRTALLTTRQSVADARRQTALPERYAGEFSVAAPGTFGPVTSSFPASHSKASWYAALLSSCGAAYQCTTVSSGAARTMFFSALCGTI